MIARSTLVSSLAMYQRVGIMVVRIARILSASVILVLFRSVPSAACDGWSLQNPFSSNRREPPENPH